MGVALQLSTEQRHFKTQENKKINKYTLRVIIHAMTKPIGYISLYLPRQPRVHQTNGVSANNGRLSHNGH